MTRRLPVPGAFNLASALVLLAAAGCGSSTTPPPGDDSDAPEPVLVPSRGTAATFDVATWNLEWFGDTGNGPADEPLQLQRVREVMQGADLDLWGVQEVVSAGAFQALVAGLPGYAGLLANAPTVEGGATWYSDFGDLEQKVGLVYKTSLVEVLGARIVLTASDHAFAGRPPLEARIRVRLDGVTVEGVVLVLHAKAGADEASWERREAAARALRDYLDATWPTVPVWVIGDFNDDVDVSITPGKPSPYGPFLGQTTTWTFATSVLSASGATTTVGYSDVIDHQLVSDEAWGMYQTSSVEAYRLDAIVPSYGTTTSDHFPVLARYRLR